MCRARLCLLKAVADAGFVEIHFPIKFTLLSDMQYASVVFLEHEPVRGHQHRLTAGRLSDQSCYGDGVTDNQSIHALPRAVYVRYGVCLAKVIRF